MDSIKKEKLILKIIKFFPALLILLCSIFMTSYISFYYLNDLKREKIIIKNEFIESNKDRIKISIESISKLINNLNLNSKETLKKELQHKINIAYNIATNIYNKNKNKLSKEEIILHIKNSLEALTFNNKQGYFSLHTMKGVNILQPIQRELEGTTIINKKDTTGKYTVREAINIAKTKGEGFMTWYSTKPNDKSKEFEKLGIVKIFEPYNLLITTGRFLEDYNKQVKKEVFDLLTVLNLFEDQDDGFVFIINQSGDLLLTKTKLSNIKDTKNYQIFAVKFENFIKSTKESIYLEYQFGEKKRKHSKISYLKKIPLFNWIIATGFNYDNLTLLIDRKQKELEEKYNQHLVLIFVASIIVTLFLLMLSLLLSKKIERIFYDYKRKLIKQETLKFEAMMEELNVIFDNLPINVIYKDTKDNIIRGNKTLANALGLSVEELRNVPTKKLFPHFYKRYYKHDLEIIKSKKVKKGIIEKYYSKDGLRLIEYSNIPIFDKNGEVKNIIVFVSDITEQETLREDNKRKEILLYQQSKMATMGEMIANIAHQWKQPLSTITVAATGSKLQKEMDCLSDTQLISSLDSINNSAQYLSQTIDDFRNFFNPDKNRFSEFKISSPIDKTLKLLLPKYKTQNIEVIQDIDDIEITSLENEIIQVLINILNNARDELIKYKCRRLIFIKTYKKENSLIIEIKDNAKGIKEDIIHKIFDSYFTTKSNNEGTGIGLYMSRSILTKLLKAEITVENETFTYEDIEYTGAKFTIIIAL